MRRVGCVGEDAKCKVQGCVGRAGKRAGEQRSQHASMLCCSRACSSVQLSCALPRAATKVSPRESKGHI